MKKYVGLVVVGHVDHGKTTLVKYLCNKDTDRLKEEKKRKISIELGYANFIHKNVDFSVIDVPGHEQFVPVMLSAMGGISLSVVVISLYDGICVQTREHLKILMSLGINKILFVITKKDLCDSDENLEKIFDELSQLNFKDVHYHIVDYTNEKSINELKEKLYDLTLNINGEKASDEEFFMYVDRSFDIKGYGRIITGTVVSGQINDMMDVYAYPQKEKIRIKQLQYFNNYVTNGKKGQRIAINIGKTKTDIKKGTLLAQRCNLLESDSCDILLEEIQYKQNSQKKLHNTKLRVYFGTTYADALLLKYDEKYASIFFTSKQYLYGFNKCIIRHCADKSTVYCAKILNNSSLRKQLDKKIAYSILNASNNETTYSLIRNIVDDDEKIIHCINDIKRRIELDCNLLNEIYKKDIIYLTKDNFILKSEFKKIENKIIEKMKEQQYNCYIKTNSICDNLDVILKNDLFKNNFTIISKSDNNYLFNNYCIYKKGSYVQYFIDEIKKLFDLEFIVYHYQILNILDTFINDTDATEKEVEKIKKQFKYAQEYLLINYISISEDAYVKSDKKIISSIIDLINEKGTITLTQIKDKLNVSRRDVRNIITYTDKIKLTKQCGGISNRQAGKNFYDYMSKM